MAWSVVIAGGGFGGFNAARRLERALPPNSARITLVNDVNFLLYSPLLPGAAGGSLEPGSFFGRAAAELGQIGHPAGLEGHSVGGTGAPSASTDRAP